MQLYPNVRYATPRPWQPLTDAEYAALAPFFTRPGAGRPLHDLRGRLDAIFWVVTSPHPWRALPPEMGPWDTAHRQFRRWTHAGIWTALLKAVAARGIPPALRRLEHWVCRAYRRALRILNLPGIVLARRLGMGSAVNAPFWMLPDPDLSEKLGPHVLRRLREAMDGPRKALLAAIQLGKAYHRLVGGRLRIPKGVAPP